MVKSKDTSPENPVEPISAVPNIQAEQCVKTRCHLYKKIFLSLLFLLVIFALAGVIYLGCQTKRLQISQAHYDLKLSQLAESIKKQQVNSNNQYNEANNNLKHSQLTITNQLKEMGQHLKTAQRQYFYHNQDWILLKARYYLELAQANDHWTDNVPATIALLQQADDLLKEMTDQSNFFPIRQEIAKEITELKALPTKDIAGLLSQLDAAQTLIAKLPLKQSTHAFTAPSSVDSEAAESSSWRTSLKNSLQILEKFVVVRRNDETIRPMLSPMHETILRDSLQMNLQTAQWAIIQNNPTIYKNSLSQALSDIKRAFDTKSNSTQALIEQLTELGKVDFNTPKPVIDESLTLLNQVINTRNSSTLSPDTQGGDSL